MVSAEYPPTHRGVCRYKVNLVGSLLFKGLQVIVISDSHAVGRYHGLSPYNNNNFRNKPKLSKMSYVKEFKKRMLWDNTAMQHLQIQLQI
jgi:hypothetical protein